MTERSSKTKKWMRFIRNGILISAAVHIVFLVAAASIVAIRSYFKPQATFYGDPPPRPRLEPQKLEMKVRVQDLQKRSSRPKLTPRIQARSPTALGLPDIKTPKQPKMRKVKRNYSTMGVSGLGLGMGGGVGTGAGGGAGGGIFGSRARLPGAWQGTIYVFDHIDRLRTPDGTYLQGANRRKQDGKIYTYNHNIAPRDFQEGFPGVTDQFEWFAIEYSATVDWSLAMAGEYDFRVEIDDGIIFQIDGKDVIVGDGFQGSRGRVVETGSANIPAGKRQLKLYYFQGPRFGIALKLEYTKKGRNAWKVFDLREVQALR